MISPIRFAALTSISKPSHNTDEKTTARYDRAEALIRASILDHIDPQTKNDFIIGFIPILRNAYFLGKSAIEYANKTSKFEQAVASGLESRNPFIRSLADFSSRFFMSIAAQVKLDSYLTNLDLAYALAKQPAEFNEGYFVMTTNTRHEVEDLGHYSLNAIEDGSALEMLSQKLQPFMKVGADNPAGQQTT